MLFDIAPSEMLLTVVVAIVVIGPKDLPLALRTAGRWMGKMRRISGHFRSGIETIIREAELEDMEKKWREQNEAIMQEHPHVDTPATAALIEHAPGDLLPAIEHHSAPDPSAYPSESPERVVGHTAHNSEEEPQLPLPPAYPRAPKTN